MAVVLKNIYISNVLQCTQSIAYIDSSKTDDYIEKMYDVVMNYIRINVFDNEMTQKENYIALNEKDILNNKPDGFWIVSDEKNFIITLFQKRTSQGFIYNNVSIEKLFVLTCEKCQRIVPNQKQSLFNILNDSLTQKVSEIRDNQTDKKEEKKLHQFEKTSLLDDFTAELTRKVNEHREKGNKQNIDIQLQSHIKTLPLDDFSIELTNKVNQYKERNNIV